MLCYHLAREIHCPQNASDALSRPWRFALMIVIYFNVELNLPWNIQIERHTGNGSMRLVFLQQQPLIRFSYMNFTSEPTRSVLVLY